MLAIVKKIIKQKMPCLFISPHLDDAILSCGGLIAYLVGKTELGVVTIFTGAVSGSHTFFAQSFVESCGFKDAEKLFDERKKEDERVLKKIGIKPIHLGFIDAAFRRKKQEKHRMLLLANIFPELVHLYPTRGAVFSGRVKRRDKKMIKIIREKLQSLTIESNNQVVFAPLGIGKHVDHLITRKVVSGNFLATVYWSDFPYNQYREENKNFLAVHELKKCVFSKRLDCKKKLILGYKTQRKIFESYLNRPLAVEKYYVPKKVN